MKIVKLLRTIANSAPKDNTQSSLNCIFFERKNILDDSGLESNEPHKNHIKIIVTNRQYIIKVEVSPLFFPSLLKDGDSALFNREIIINALKGMKSKDNISISVDEKYNSSLDTYYTINNKHLGQKIHGSFPPWNRPWKDASTSRNTDVHRGIGINMKLLSVITDLMTSVTSRTSNALITFGDELDAVTFEFNGKSYTEGLYKVEACLMPVKI